MKNKRNYYRLLHVQVDAPVSVIKASYRAMMQKLQLHPDLGGDDWNASLLNEARDTLLDPDKRRAHDEKLVAAGYPLFRHRKDNLQSVAGGTPEPMDVPQTNPTVTDAETIDLVLHDTTRKCPFCQKPIIWEMETSALYPTQVSCTRCDSPLMPPNQDRSSCTHDMRKINRSYFEFVARVWDHWPMNGGHAAMICDWSTAGCGIELAHELQNNQVILVRSPGFDAVAEVRHQRHTLNEKMIYGLEYLSVEIRMEAGALVSSAA